MAEVTPTERVSAEERIKQIQERAEQATPGPWVRWAEHAEVFCQNDGLNNPGEMSGNQICECEPDDLPDFDEPLTDDEDAYQIQAEANAEFIAHARQDIPWLLSEVEELRALTHFCKSPCGHSSQYAYSEDGGKNIVCLLCEVEELRKQVAALERNVADFDNSYFQDEGIAADGEIRKLTSNLRGRALAAEAEADRLRDTLESAKRTIDYEQEISTQLASRAETLSKRLREIIAIWYSRSQNKIVEMGDAVAKAESALSLPPSEEEPRP